ncbi:hypothetical protein ACE1ET_12175 [Saccharicrinis sp. FJH62]|uniref:YobI family P-loop NTPase n=1 Tax=Saccharicrinis sp. FJH62 TaxID=3344657 RepID=UPI0035D423BB
MNDNNIPNYFNLSPSLDVNEHIYFDALKEKLNDNTVKNIAVTGPYGSGKSSILDSFFEKNKQYNYLKISLANYCESKEEFDKNDEKIIEEHILQQLFYQLNDNRIPFSTFKKIGHLNQRSQFKITLFSLIWLFATAFMPWVIKLIYSNLQILNTIKISEIWKLIYWPSTLVNIIILLIFWTGLFYILKDILRIKQKGQLKKIAMKSAQVELAEDSALNKHIDEIIYFFEATTFQFVVIEDLDRFNSTTLFSKLREVNLLINNSPKVFQKVGFIYAVKDDIFKDNFNRTKFFDFILPIVPVINTTNSGDKLRLYLRNETSIPQSYINDISLYIHDLRLLKNMVNEYRIYDGIINKDQMKKGVFLFSIILYKNLFPEEFSKDHHNEGLLYNTFKVNKISFSEKIIEAKKVLLENSENEKEEILNESVQTEIKLRGEYILEILKTYSNIKNICGESISKMIEDNKSFEKLLGDSPYYNSTYYDINFDEIENNVNSKKNYAERLGLIQKRKNGRNEELTLKIAKIKKELNQLQRQKLASLLKTSSKDNNPVELIFGKNLKEIKQKHRLLALLIRKGYIEENYQLYISHFYEGALSLKDFEYLLNVKNNEGNNFNTEIDNKNEVLSRITDDEYEYESTLNKFLIVYLLKSTGFKEDKRLELLLEQFKVHSDSFENYISPLIVYLKETSKEYKRFIELLVEKYYPELWKAIELQNYDISTKDNLLKSLLFLSENNIKALHNTSEDNSLKNYLEKKSDFIEVFDSMTYKLGIFKLIKALELKFCNLKFKRYQGNKIFDYIYENNHYELNESMLYLMLFNNYELGDDSFKECFNTRNYTCILESEDDILKDYILDNFHEYVEKIYLKLNKVQIESEDALYSFCELLNVEEDVELLINVLNKTTTLINDIDTINNKEIWSLLFTTGHIQPKWVNFVKYILYNENKLDIIIIEWLNRKEVYEELKQSHFKNEINSLLSEDDIVILIKNLTESKKLSIDAYTIIIKVLPDKLYNIDLKSLSYEKISILIQNQKLVYNENNYDQLLLMELYDLLSEFTINNFIRFKVYYNDFEYNIDLHIALFESTRLNIRDKKALIRKIDNVNLENTQISNSVGKILFKSKEKIVKKNRLLIVITNCANLELKLKLFNKFFTEFDFSDIDKILISLGGVYRKARVKRKRPQWKKNRINIALANNLLAIGYFHKIKIEDDKIKIVVRYS